MHGNSKRQKFNFKRRTRTQESTWRARSSPHISPYSYDVAVIDIVRVVCVYVHIYVRVCVSLFPFLLSSSLSFSPYIFVSSDLFPSNFFPYQTHQRESRSVPISINGFRQDQPRGRNATSSVVVVRDSTSTMTLRVKRVTAWGTAWLISWFLCLGRWHTREKVPCHFQSILRPCPGSSPDRYRGRGHEDPGRQGPVDRLTNDRAKSHEDVHASRGDTHRLARRSRARTRAIHVPL